MQKRVFIIHGWEGSPQNSWLPWLKDKLKSSDYLVEVPLMPNPDVPEINTWISHLSSIVGIADKNTFFVGHSIGCQAILRYVERLPKKPIGGIVCVAGFFRLLHLETDEDKKIAKPWLETKIDFNKIKERTNKIVAIFSDNDPDVDLGNKDLFEKHLNAKTIVEHNMGHFSDDTGVKELPSALKALLEIASNK